LLAAKLADRRRGADVVAAGWLNGQSHFDCCAATSFAAQCRGVLFGVVLFDVITRESESGDPVFQRP